MERERPEYLPPIQGRRWEFPWMLTIAIALLAIMAGGLSMLAKTNAAWKERFSPDATIAARPVTKRPEGDAVRSLELGDIRQRRAQAQREADIAERRLRADTAARDGAEMRCINGILFRRIPGGWENVPGRTCLPDESRYPPL